jgi:hypothetical protein
MTPLSFGSAGFFYRRHRPHPDRHISRASGSLAAFTSRTILPVASTIQTLVSLTDTSNPAKWSMLRFSF